MRRGEKAETVTYRGESLTYRQPGWHCESCDDGILDGSDNAYADAALHEVMARAKGAPISPLMIRAARQAVGVSQRRAGKIFGRSEEHTSELQSPMRISYAVICLKIKNNKDRVQENIRNK